MDEPVALAEFLAAALGELAHHGIHGLITDQHSAAKTGVPSGMDKLEQDLADGHKLIVGLNAKPIWGKPVENKTKDGHPAADHAVVVTGVDTAGGIVHLNDSGTPMAETSRYPSALHRIVGHQLRPNDRHRGSQLTPSTAGSRTLQLDRSVARRRSHCGTPAVLTTRIIPEDTTFGDTRKRCQCARFCDVDRIPQTPYDNESQRPRGPGRADSALVTSGMQFGVLGPLQMSIDDFLLPLGTPKQRAVLAMLVINRNRPVGVESLITALWEQRPPPGARASLHSYVSNLRKLISSVGIDPRSVLAAAPPGYRLSIPDTAYDLGRFIAKKTVGVHAAAAGRFEEASRHLSAALAEWRGPVLDDLREFQFIDAFATALVEDKIFAYTAHAEAEIACGRGYAVIGELETLTAEHPYREPLWAQLITAYYLADRQSDALDAYRRVKTTLADDLGIDPGPTLRGLHERILRQEPLNAKKAARTTAVGAITALDQRTTASGQAAIAYLHEASGRSYPLQAVATRIGRLLDNDIVLDDANVSRHHAVIIDTGTSYIINDLRSANGVHVQHQRIRSAATLNDGDHIRICDHAFTFQINTESWSETKG